jgi:hypothetical protein
LELIGSKQVTPRLLGFIGTRDPNLKENRQFGTFPGFADAPNAGALEIRIGRIRKESPGGQKIARFSQIGNALGAMDPL